MRILHINKFFDARDGTDIYLQRLMERQAQAGHEAHVLATRAATNVVTPDARIFPERHDYKRREGAVKDARKAAAFVWNREARQATEAALREYKPDVVHLHNVYHHLTTSILSPIRNSGVGCVQTLHDYKLACPNYKMFTENAPCERCRGGHYLQAVKHHCLGAAFSVNALAVLEMGLTKAAQSYEKTVGRFICPSRFMAEKMREWGEPPSKLVYVPNPVEVMERKKNDGEYILFAGRLSAEKGIETLVRAGAQVPQCRIRIAGTGPEEQRLRGLALSLKAENIEFTGFLRKSEMQQALSGAKALAVPSVWYENAPGSVLEAMACGLPVMASRNGGLPEMVEDGVTGFLLEAGNVEEWRAGLVRILSATSEEIKKLGEAAQKKAREQFTWERHLAELEKHYSEVKKK